MKKLIAAFMTAIMLYAVPLEAVTDYRIQNAGGTADPVTFRIFNTGASWTNIWRSEPNGDFKIFTPTTVQNALTVTGNLVVSGTLSVGGGGFVSAFNTRTGAVAPLQADYDSFFLTPSEGVVKNTTNILKPATDVPSLRIQDTGGGAHNLITFEDSTGNTVMGSVDNTGTATFNTVNATVISGDDVYAAGLEVTNTIVAGSINLSALPTMVGATGGVNGQRGVVPQPLAGQNLNFLRGDGTWAASSATVMTGATNVANGTSGTVPQPIAGDDVKFLRGDATWGTVTGGSDPDAVKKDAANVITTSIASPLLLRPGSAPATDTKLIQVQTTATTTAVFSVDEAGDATMRNLALAGALSGGSGYLASFNGRTVAAAVATAGDYTATQVTNAPAGNIAAVTVQAAITELDSEKVGAASPALTGDPTAPTASTGDNDTSIATTAFVKAQAYAPLASPALTGTPTAPTASAATNTTQVATTAFVQSETLNQTEGDARYGLLTGNNVFTSITAPLLIRPVSSPAANAKLFDVQTTGTTTSVASVDVEGDIAGRNLTLTGTLSGGSGYVLPTRSITAGGGLSGGGDLSADRTLAVAANGVDNTMLRDSAGLSIIGRSANTSGDPADISASIDGSILRLNGTTLGFGTINLASANAVTGTLAVGNGGVGVTTYTLGDLLYASGTSTLTKLAPNATATRAKLVQTGNGSVSAAPMWLADSATNVISVAAGTIAATTVQAALDELDTEKAPKASPALTGDPTAPSAASSDNDTSVATTAHVKTAIAAATIAGSSVSHTPVAPLTSTNADGAIDELAAMSLRRVIQVKLSPDAAQPVVGDGALTLIIYPELNGFKLVDVDIFVSAPSTSTLPTVQVAKNGTDVLSTRATIDINEYSSYTAATAAVINTGVQTVATGDLIRVDIDVTGNTATRGLGLILTFAP